MKKLASSVIFSLLVLVALFMLSSCSQSTTSSQSQCQHQWIEATCSQPKTCSICNTIIGNPLGHSWRSATCVEPKICTICNEVSGEPLGHTEVIDKAISPTCTTNGFTEGKHCSVCNKILIAQTKISANGHNVVVDKSLENTCTQEGLTQGSHCSKCNTILVCQTSIPKTQHINKNGTCVKCGTILNAHEALAYYILCNGEYNNKGWYYIMDTKTVDGNEHSYYIFADSNALSLSFVSISYVSNTYQYVEIYLDDYNSMQDVYMEYESSTGISDNYGTIDGNTFSSSNKIIYGYEYDGDFSSLASKYENLFALNLDALLYSINLFVLPDFVTMQELGFTNY